MRKRLFAVLLVVSLTGCAQLLQGRLGGSSTPSETSDDELRQNYPEGVATRVIDVREKRRAALAAPTALAPANAYADALLDALKHNLHTVGGVDWTQYSKDAVQVLGTAAPKGTAEETSDALAKRAMFQDALSDEPGAIATRERSFGYAHTYLSGVGMIWVHRKKSQGAEAQALCVKTRPLAKDDDQLYTLLNECLQAAPTGETLEERLSWANAADVALFKQKNQELAEANLRRREAEAEADRERRERQATMPPPEDAAHKPPSGSSPAGPQRASFSLRSSCSRTVKLFFGQTPKFGSGRSTTVSGNSVQNESMNEGEMIWIVDDHGDGVSSFTASSGVHEVEISSNCSSFRAR